MARRTTLFRETQSLKQIISSLKIFADRKLRLYAVAVCRWSWELLGDERLRHAVEAAELYADNLLNDEQLVDFRNDAAKADWSIYNPYGFDAAVCCATSGYLAASGVSDEPHGCDPDIHKDILVDIFGSDGGDFDAVWRNFRVLSIARQAYNTRDFSSLPILADALDDVGCDNVELLEHLRSEASHCRGCWALDSILGLT